METVRFWLIGIIGEWTPYGDSLVDWTWLASAALVLLLVWGIIRLILSFTRLFGGRYE